MSSKLNNHLSEVKAELDTDTGELHLIILDDEEDEVLNKKCKLSKDKEDEESIVRFSMDNHPETDRKESFKGVLWKPRWRNLWVMMVYPLFGRGTISTGKITVGTTGNNEYFTD